MHRITGNYVDKSNKEVPFDFQVPGSWDELTTGQTASILQVLSYSRADKYTTMASLIALLCDKNWTVLANLPNEELHDLMPLTNFIFETRPAVKNLFPTLKIRKKLHLSPADDLSNIGFGEFCFAYQAWHTYQVHNEKSFLDKLIAVLYRPADPQQVVSNPAYAGDQREPFNENLIAERERAIKDIGEKEKIAVLTWFSSAMLQLMELRPHVFPKAEADSMEAEAEESGRTWFDIFRELLGPKWGHINDLKFTNAAFVLDGLEETIREGKTQSKPVE